MYSEHLIADLILFLKSHFSRVSLKYWLSSRASDEVAEKRTS